MKILSINTSYIFLMSKISPEYNQSYLTGKNIYSGGKTLYFSFHNKTPYTVNAYLITNTIQRSFHMKNSEAVSHPNFHHWFESKYRSLLNFHFVRFNSEVQSKACLNSDVFIQHIRYSSKYPCFLIPTDLGEIIFLVCIQVISERSQV